MEFSIKQTAPEKARTDCVVVAIDEGGKFSAAAQTLDRASGGAIRKLVGSGDLRGKHGAAKVLFRLPGIAAERVLVVGMGAQAGRKEFRDAVRNATALLADTGARDACYYFAELPVSGVDAAWKARHFALA